MFFLLLHNLSVIINQLLIDFSMVFNLSSQGLDLVFQSVLLFFQLLLKCKKIVYPISSLGNLVSQCLIFNEL